MNYKNLYSPHINYHTHRNVYNNTCKLTYYTLSIPYITQPILHRNRNISTYTAVPLYTRTALHNQPIHSYTTYRSSSKSVPLLSSLHQRTTLTRSTSSHDIVLSSQAMYHPSTGIRSYSNTSTHIDRVNSFLRHIGINPLNMVDTYNSNQQSRDMSSQAEKNDTGGQEQKQSATEQHSLPFDEKYDPPKRVVERSYIKSFDEYKKIYDESIRDPEKFWGEQAKKYISWFQPFDRVKAGTWAENGHVAWFLNGKLNACYNMVDRHILAGRGDKLAMIAEGDEPDDIRTYTYNQLLDEVCKMANALKVAGVRKGDGVCIYMPNIPEALIAIMAVVRLGAFHNVIFAGFSSDAIKERIIDSNNRFVICSDESCRGGRKFPLKKMVDEALKNVPKDQIRKVFVHRRTGADVNMEKGRDVYIHDAMKSERPYCPPVPMDAEDPLFTLYTSGSTGKPKGLLHTTAGYLLYTMITQKYVFDFQDGDVYACLADIAWVTGHSYICYGPLLCGGTTFVFESTPVYPKNDRYWNSIQKHKINIMYSSPTAIRTLMKFGKEPIQGKDLSSLRILGTVGEPINPEAWRWFYEHVGNKQCSIVDTYWQTETGGHMMTPLPGATPQKPGSCSFPFFGLQVALMDPNGKEVQGDDVSGNLVVKTPWPGMARTIWGDHSRYIDTYLKVHPGVYTTGDGALRDKDGYYWITGRTDDVVNVSGHRIGSAEIEGAIVSNKDVAECATIGIPHEVKGSSLFCYVILKQNVERSDDLVNKLKNAVKEQVGSFAKPDDVVIVPGLPKTRSGKIMRRMLRKIAEGETDLKKLGDVTTLERPEIVDEILNAAKEQRSTKKN